MKPLFNTEEGQRLAKTIEHLSPESQKRVIAVASKVLAKKIMRLRKTSSAQSPNKPSP